MDTSTGGPVALQGEQLSFDELGTPLRETTFVVFDLETTGGSAQSDGITEIGAVKVRGGEVLGEFATLVDPERGIPAEVVQLTGITEAMVSAAPRLEQVLPAFLEFAAQSVLVAHNSGFDVGFLRAACTRLGYRWPRPPVVCTVRLARRALSREEAPSCRLSALAALFGAATTPNHRALADARATVDVLHSLLGRVGSLGVQSLEELLAYTAEVPDEVRRKRQLAADLPDAPGVYLFRGPSEEVLYVGTASNLRRRVRQYFTTGEKRRRIGEMVRLATGVDTVRCAHSLEAGVRELRLLAAHRPAYNRRSRNQFAGWWVVLTDEPFPRLSVVRSPRDGALGPFASRVAAAAAADALTEASGLRPCTQRIPAQRAAASPCALAELGRCAAPCAGRQSVPEYAPLAQPVRRLAAGVDTEALHRLLATVHRLGAAQRYEEAADRRDRLVALARSVGRGQRLAALAEVAELVAARPDGTGGWELSVIRHGRLAAAGRARRGEPPMPVVELLCAGAQTMLPAEGPLRGAPAEEVGLVLRWLERPGTRMVRCSTPWAEPAGAAASWHAWAEQTAEQAQEEVAAQAPARAPEHASAPEHGDAPVGGQARPRVPVRGAPGEEVPIN